MKTLSRPIIGYGLAVLGMFLLYLAACSAPAPVPAAVGLVQPADGQYLCTLDGAGDGFRLVCDPAAGPTPTLAPTRTPTTEPPTATPEPPANTPEPPANTPEPTPTEPPVAHDVNACHGAETGDGHTHGYCVDDLPAGAVRDFLIANPEFGELDHPWPTSAIENVYPWPDGKHEGFKNLYAEFPGCYQITNILPTPEAMCLKALWLQPHTLQTAHEIRTPGSTHSLLFVAEVCDQATFSQCTIVAGAQPTGYGEVHSQYKETGCLGIEGGVYFPEPYSVNDGDPDDAQVPYIAAHNSPNFFSRPARGFWNSQVNAVLVPTLGDINELVEVAWTENLFSVPSANPDLCHDAAADRVWAPSTDAGFKNEFVLWSFRMDDLPDYPEGWSFTGRTGHPATGCEAASFDCIPFYKGPGTTPGQAVFYNIPVRNAFDPFEVPAGVPVVDITEPGVLMPGYAGD